MSPKGASTVKLTKHEHACVVLEKDGARSVIDPGAFSPNAADIIAGADAVLITHEHADHVHEGAVNEALAARPELAVYAPATMAGMFSAHAGQFTPVAAGDAFTIGDFTISVHGADHEYGVRRAIVDAALAGEAQAKVEFAAASRRIATEFDSVRGNAKNERDHDRRS